MSYTEARTNYNHERIRSFVYQKYFLQQIAIKYIAWGDPFQFDTDTIITFCNNLIKYVA